MKPKNFPARKLARQMWANGLSPAENQMKLQQARAIRTKKVRSS